ncbi:hypothetical protein LTR84_001997 [Exophiala bonariae]|uniref:MARVEL domain-containing protein n=1 Tax=Exophiala bonariae TaxID=1690606 RepID=A0AAV9ND16_9EURO|nr:hypothetical protein LTR84_001997 [Exophiala bonariae]
MAIGVLKTPNGDDAARLFLILNDIVGITLCFVGGRAIYFVLGSTLIVSMIFNMVSILAQGNATRQKLKRDEPVRPNMFGMCLEIFGTLALIIMYTISVVDTTAWDYSYWNTSPVFLHAYGGVTGLIAFVMHGVMSVKKIAQYVKYRQSLSNSCPHCKRGYEDRPASKTPAGKAPALEPSPLSLTACETHSPRVSFSANTVGEGENDNLIMKE